MSKLFTTGGHSYEINPEEREWFLLEELQDLVGGFVEQLPVYDGALFFNEDGIARDMPYNPGASELASPHTILGQAVHITAKEMESYE